MVQDHERAGAIQNVGCLGWFFGMKRHKSYTVGGSTNIDMNVVTDVVPIGDTGFHGIHSTIVGVSVPQLSEL